ncbi:uncharacterized protein LOC127848147 [Dreissena polymorpha]|uniref:Uncharacterized protein n=1 Tax=Dreissena polymorpha TaxID=45954 RepID=A0A9D4DQB3_DREPO|nr:uncharacterized protein LOC127848147 [Dreissena polymorpha]KAH3751804.1 hypothetical protein DPMN_186378 [Dreissena polymorpha]
MNKTEMYIITALLICALVENSAEAKRSFHHMLGKRTHGINARGYTHVFGKRGRGAELSKYDPYRDTNDLNMDELDTLESKDDEKGFDDQLQDSLPLAINWPEQKDNRNVPSDSDSALPLAINWSEQKDTRYVPSDSDSAESEGLDVYDKTPWSPKSDHRYAYPREGSDLVDTNTKILEELLRSSSADERSKLFDRINELSRSSAHKWK